MYFNGSFYSNTIFIGSFGLVKIFYISHLACVKEYWRTFAVGWGICHIPVIFTESTYAKIAWSNSNSLSRSFMDLQTEIYVQAWYSCVKCHKIVLELKTIYSSLFINTVLLAPQFTQSVMKQSRVSNYCICEVSFTAQIEYGDSFVNRLYIIIHKMCRSFTKMKRASKQNIHKGVCSPAVLLH